MNDINLHSLQPTRVLNLSIISCLNMHSIRLSIPECPYNVDSLYNSLLVTQRGLFFSILATNEHPATDFGHHTNATLPN